MTTYIGNKEHNELYNLFNTGTNGNYSITKEHNMVILKEQNDVWMNSRAGVGNERRRFLSRAYGRVLILGLGLGCDLHILSKSFAIRIVTGKHHTVLSK